MQCFLCKVLKESENRRRYYETKDFVILEDLFLMTPLLVFKEHTNKDIGIDIFLTFKDVVTKLHGHDFSMAAAKVTDQHFFIKAIPLNFKDATFPVPPPVAGFDVDF